MNARDAGIVVVVAAGNKGEDTSPTPANIYDAFAAGASDESRNIAVLSSGEEVVTDEAWGNDALDHWPETYVVPNVVEPGINVLCADPGDGYDSRSSTSMATPHAAGAAALLSPRIPTSRCRKSRGASKRRRLIRTVTRNRIVDAHTAISSLSDEPTVADYSNEDGVVTTTGLSEEIDDWRDDEIDIELLGDVIDYWRSGAEI